MTGSAAVLLTFLLVQNPEANYRLQYMEVKLKANGFSKQEITSLWQKARLYQPVRPPSVSWQEFIKNRLLDETAIRRGIWFMEKYAERLALAEKLFGTPKEIITAILRLETEFGDNLGSNEVFNLFYTRALTRNSDRWKKPAHQLVALATYCKRAGVDCFSIRGSHEGAAHLFQWMPEESLNFGHDGKVNRVVDLSDMNYAITSTGYILVKKGSRKNLMKALASYYGSANGYPRAILAYARAIRNKKIIYFGEAP